MKRESDKDFAKRLMVSITIAALLTAVVVGAFIGLVVYLSRGPI